MLRARPFDWVLIYKMITCFEVLDLKKADDVVLLSILKCWSFFYDSCWRCESLDHDHSHHGRLGSWIKCHHNGYTNTLYTTIIMFYNLSFLILLYNDGVFIFLVDFFDGNNAQSCLLRLSSTGLVYYSYKYWCNGRKSSGHRAHCLVRGRGGSILEQLSLFTQIININYQKHTRTSRSRNYKPCWVYLKRMRLSLAELISKMNSA